MRVGLLGGSFDPIHFGHLSLAAEMREAHQLDEIWLCPTGRNPLKPQKSTTSAQDRLAMVKLAIEGTPWLKVIENEIHQPQPSYTIDTLRTLQITHPDVKFFVIIGDDVARNFSHWKLPEEILKKAQILVGRRHDLSPESPFEGAPTLVGALNKGLTRTRVLEISSSELRLRLSKRLYCNPLMPAKVIDYILAHRLYL